MDKVEGFLIFMNLDKSEEDLKLAEEELKDCPDRYCLISKLTFYEIKKLMECFVNEKVYDIDTKDKLLDIISAKEAKENFLEFIYDHLIELDKWQQFYKERLRIRIIEWLRKFGIVFVFEEDLELSKNVVEKLKEHTFDTTVSRDLTKAREVLDTKAKTYYSSEALNPRPKRGRPPKQSIKKEIDPALAEDIYTTIPGPLRHFLFAPEYSSNTATFSSKFDSEEQLLASLKGSAEVKVDSKLEILSQRLESLTRLSNKLKYFQADTEVVPEYAVSAGEPAGVVEKGKKSPKVTKFVEGVLPKRSPKSQKRDIKELMEKKQKGVKRVTQIKRKKGIKSDE